MPREAAMVAMIEPFSSTVTAPLSRLRAAGRAWYCAPSGSGIRAQGPDQRDSAGRPCVRPEWAIAAAGNRDSNLPAPLPEPGTSTACRRGDALPVRRGVSPRCRVRAGSANCRRAVAARSRHLGLLDDLGTFGLAQSVAFGTSGCHNAGGFSDGCARGGRRASQRAVRQSPTPCARRPSSARRANVSQHRPGQEACCAIAWGAGRQSAGAVRPLCHPAHPPRGPGSHLPYACKAAHVETTTRGGSR